MKITVKVKGYDKKKFLEEMAEAIDSLMQAHEAEQEPTLADLPVIDWANAPEDAVCHANDSGGGGFFYTEVAVPMGGAWKGNPWSNMISSGLPYLGESMPPFNGDGWKQTLQMRPEPEVEEVEAFEWVEDRSRPFGVKCENGYGKALIFNSKTRFVWEYVVTFDGRIKELATSGESNARLDQVKAIAEAFITSCKEMEDDR